MRAGECPQDSRPPEQVPRAAQQGVFHEQRESRSEPILVPAKDEDSQGGVEVCHCGDQARGQESKAKDKGQGRVQGDDRLLREALGNPQKGFKGQGEEAHDRVLAGHQGPHHQNRARARREADPSVCQGKEGALQARSHARHSRGE